MNLVRPDFTQELDYEYDYAVPAYFAVTKYCNIRCSYCYLPEEYKNRKDSADEQALSGLRKLVDKAKKEKFALEVAYLHGAEATTLSPEAMKEAVSLLQEITVRRIISVQTNGIALNKRYLDEIGDMQNDVSFGYSVDLPPAAHNKNRQKTYNKVIGNIKLARDRGYQHRLLACINKDTMEDLEAVEREIAYYHQEFPGMTIAFKMITGDLQLTEGQSVDWANFMLDRGLQDYAHALWGPHQICHAKGNNCWWFEFSFDGNVTACNKSYNDEGVFANWIDEPMSYILQKRMALYQNHAVPTSCFGCEYWSICQGGCPEDRKEVFDTMVDDKTKVSVTGKRIVALDCKVRKTAYARMKKSGINPIAEAYKIPRFNRQKAFFKWRRMGKEYGFME